MSDIIEYRHGNDGLNAVVSLETALVCEDESLAVQSAAADADINTIVRRFNVTGQLPAFNREPFYGDFTNVGDYRDALHKVMEADASFAALPAEVRKRFDNDPALLYEYLHTEFDEAKLAEARSLGLVGPEEPIPAPVRVEVVSPPAAPPGGSAGV